MTEKQGKKMAGNVQDAGMTRRFIAYLIDWYVGALATALPISMVAMKLYGTVKNQQIMEFAAPMGMVAGAMGLLCAVLYYWVVPAAVWKGQTLGKRWLHIKIVGADGGEATPGMLARRQLLGIIVVEGSLVSASTIWHQMATMATGINLVTPLMYAGIAVSLVSAIMVLFGGHRAIHDYLGGSRVIFLGRPEDK